MKIQPRSDTKGIGLLEEAVQKRYDEPWCSRASENRAILLLWNYCTQPQIMQILKPFPEEYFLFQCLSQFHSNSRKKITTSALGDKTQKFQPLLTLVPRVLQTSITSPAYLKRYARILKTSQLVFEILWSKYKSILLQINVNTPYFLQ